MENKIPKTPNKKDNSKGVLINTKRLDLFFNHIKASNKDIKLKNNKVEKPKTKPTLSRNLISIIPVIILTGNQKINIA